MFLFALLHIQTMEKWCRRGQDALLGCVLSNSSLAFANHTTPRSRLCPPYLMIQTKLGWGGHTTVARVQGLQPFFFWNSINGQGGVGVIGIFCATDEQETFITNQWSIQRHFTAASICNTENEWSLMIRRGAYDILGKSALMLENSLLVGRGWTQNLKNAALCAHLRVSSLLYLTLTSRRVRGWSFITCEGGLWSQILASSDLYGRHFGTGGGGGGIPYEKVGDARRTV